MDGGELARQEASAAHETGVSLGDDPTQPYAFVLAQAKRQNIDVETATSGAAILDGGRATLIPADRLIVHENVGSEFEQAFLVAHELGHALMGDDVGHVTVSEIDPSRPAEPSPMGLDRVADYGRRQRREVQMDLFARELLLPRSFVRRLHVDEHLTASAIAERMRAPFQVVAQQLLDALLLPVVTIDSTPHGPARPLNDLQAAAAAHRGGPYLLEAGPGTGKTQTLTARIEGLLDDGVDPRRVLVLTFSNRAAGELAERIGRKSPAAAAAMWIGTFHAFGLDIIRRFHAELCLPRDLRMMDRPEAVELFERHFPRLRLHHFGDLYDPTRNIGDLLAAVSRAKDEVVGVDEYARLAEAMRTSATTEDEIGAAERCVEASTFYREYEAIKQQAACIDFGDLISLPVRLAEGNTAVCATLRQTYEHVLVDEYQDVNRASVRLLQALCPAGQNLWVVGDAKQSIYRFRGASSFNVARFGDEDFRPGHRGRLSTNYRSRREIVDTFSTFASGMAVAQGTVGLDSDRGVCGHRPELRTVADGDKQAVAIADTIEEMRRAGHPYRDQAVLCTGNERLAEIGRDLEALGIPVLFLGSLFERQEVRDLFAVLSLLVDGRAMGLVRLGCTKAFRMTLTDVASVVDYLRDREYTDGKWLADLDELPVSVEGRSPLAALAVALAGFDARSHPWDVLATFLLDRTRIAADLATAEAITDRAQGIAIWQFMNFVRAQPAAQGLPIRRLLDRVRRLVRIGDDRDLRRPPTAALGLDAVKLMTVHGAKGLEFAVVHFPGMNRDTVPGNAVPPACLPPNGMVAGAHNNALETFRLGNSEERECLFYVAASRARDRLFFYAVTHNARGATRPLSPFLDRMAPKVLCTRVSPTRVIPAPQSAMQVELFVDGPLRFSGPQIALYESCPRRFLYTHVLHIGGRRTETSYMRMHEAVRSVVQAIVATGTVTVPVENALVQSVIGAFARAGMSNQDAIIELQEAAVRMIRYFYTTRAAHTSEIPAPLRLVVGGDELTFLPDDVVTTPRGEQVFRVVRTGRTRATDADDVSAAAHLLAARQAHSASAVELVYLTDANKVKLNLSQAVISRRQAALSTIFAGIRAGAFPTKESDRVCPNCPAFFVCGQTPNGRLERKF